MTQRWVGDSTLSGWLNVEWMTQRWVDDSSGWLNIKWMTQCWVGDSTLSGWLNVEWVTQRWVGDSMLSGWFNVEWMIQHWVEDSKLSHSLNEEQKLRNFWRLASLQGHSKVFTTGQAKVNPEHDAIKCVGSWQLSKAHMAFLSLAVWCSSLSNLQISLALCLILT